MMESMFMCELNINESGKGVWLLEIKKKAFLEGMEATLYDIAASVSDLKDKDGKITPESIAEYSEKRVHAINLELCEMLAFEAHFMIADKLPKTEGQIKVLQTPKETEAKTE
jgi:hypothetical protein